MTARADRGDLVPMAFFAALIGALLFVVGSFLMEVLGEVLAGGPLGEGLLYSPAVLLWLLMLAVPVTLLTAFPLGILYGGLMIWRGASTKAMAAIAGAGTGVTLIAALAALGAEDFRGLLFLASVFAGLGAISGLLAFRLVVGGSDEPQIRS